MKGFGIYIQNDLLEAKHCQQMGDSVWLFMWFLDKMTVIDHDKGEGKVLGGKPIKFEDVKEDLGISRSTYVRWLGKLNKGKYIRTLRTPYGTAVTVLKAKKVFGKSIKNDVSKMEHHSKADVAEVEHLSVENDTSDVSKMTHLSVENDTSNKIIQKTVTEDSNRRHELKVPEGTLLGAEWNEIIDSFEPVNRFYARFYKNKTQRQAIVDILSKSTKIQLLKVIKLLPQTNKKNFFPQINTPVQLCEKWSALEDALIRYKQKGIDSMKIDTQTVDKFPTK